MEGVGKSERQGEETRHPGSREAWQGTAGECEDQSPLQQPLRTRGVWVGGWGGGDEDP